MDSMPQHQKGNTADEREDRVHTVAEVYVPSTPYNGTGGLASAEVAYLRAELIVAREAIDDPRARAAVLAVSIFDDKN